MRTQKLYRQCFLLTRLRGNCVHGTRRIQLFLGASPTTITRSKDLAEQEHLRYEKSTGRHHQHRAGTGRNGCLEINQLEGRHPSQRGINDFQELASERCVVTHFYDISNMSQITQQNPVYWPLPWLSTQLSAYPAIS